MKTIHNLSGSGRITTRNSGSLVLLFANGTIELPSSAELTNGSYFFMPVGDVQTTISCHGNDRIEGLKDIVIQGQKRHGIYSLGGRYIADFEVAPVISVPEQKPEPELTETAA